MTLNDWGKAGLLLACMASAVLLAVLGLIAGEAALGVIVYVAGYLTGNGVLARRREAPSTVLAPKLEAPPEAER